MPDKRTLFNYRAIVYDMAYDGRNIPVITCKCRTAELAKRAWERFAHRYGTLYLVHGQVRSRGVWCDLEGCAPSDVQSFLESETEDAIC